MPPPSVARGARDTRRAAGGQPAEGHERAAALEAHANRRGGQSLTKSSAWRGSRTMRNRASRAALSGIERIDDDGVGSSIGSEVDRALSAAYEGGVDGVRSRSSGEKWTSCAAAGKAGPGARKRSARPRA